MKTSARKSIVQLTHTDVRTDSRILKTIEALSVFEEFQTIAIGCEVYENTASGKTVKGFDCITLTLATQRMKFLPRALRLSLVMLEYTLRSMITAIRHKPAVVYCHDTIALVPGYLLSRITGAKLIYDAHELESDKNGQSKTLSKGTLLIEKVAWKRVDLFITVSDSIMDWYMQTFGEKNSIVVLNSPVWFAEKTTQHALAKQKYFQEKFSLASEDKIFIYLGILTLGRGIEKCLKVFSDAKCKGHLVMMGYGPLEETVQAAARSNANIHYHPSVPHEEVVPLVKNADFGLCMIEDISLSDYYCLPNKLFEYAFAGTPVISSDLPELRKVVTQYELGHVCEDSHEALLQLVNELSNKKSTRVVRDLSPISWQAQSEKIQNGFKELIA